MDTTCNVIIPEGYSSVEEYLNAHEASREKLAGHVQTGFCINPLSGNKPRTAPNKWLRKAVKPVDRPRKTPVSVPQIPVAVHTIAATFERLGRERGVAQHEMPVWIEAACRVTLRAMGHPADVVA